MIVETVHANLVARNGQGILITGKPGRGKSTLTLRLLANNYQLVADDLVRICFWQGSWWGCVANWDFYGYLHHRQWGMINVAQQYGISYCCPWVRVDDRHVIAI